MRGCLPFGSVFCPLKWRYRGLVTSHPAIPPNSGPNQLSNAELLKLLDKGKDAATTSPITQVGTKSLEQQKDGVYSESLSLLAARRPQLSQSPLIDPRLVAARIRHREKKPNPSGDRTPFQLKLQKNPYAVALTSPPRLCLLTGIRLPSFFQIPFGLATHPNTGAPWYLPHLSGSPSLSPIDKGKSGEESVDAVSPSPSSSPSPFHAPLSRNPPGRTVSGTYFLASRQVLSHVSTLTRSQYGRLIPFRWKEDQTIKTKEIIWREDMDTFVLATLRKRVSKTLTYLASRPAAYIAACKNSDCIDEHTQVAAVLWLGDERDTPNQGRSSTSQASLTDADKAGPSPYAMHHYKTRYVPCYNLPTLLGPACLRTVRESSPTHYGAQFAVIKMKRTTVEVQLELWKLLGFLTTGTGALIV